MWKCIIKTDTLILGTDYLTMNNHLFVRLRKNFEYITGLPVYILANKVFLSCCIICLFTVQGIYHGIIIYLTDLETIPYVHTYMCVYYVF